tara:strand:+ start:2067 stop:2642 length:576 start_codon:yes stop_codon:yes gene_type:complete
MAKEGQALAINDEAHQKMLAYLETTRHPVRDKAVYLLTYRAGMRIGSVAGLMLDDVIDAQGALRQVVILRKKITKGSKTITAYINHPELQEALQDWLKCRENKPYAPLFFSQKGGEFSANSLTQVMLKHYKKAGLEGYSSHSGRRGAISAWCKAGIDIVAVSKLAGHSSLNTTMRYIHHDQDELMQAVAGI